MASLLLNAFMTKLILAGISSSRVKFWQWKDDILLIRHRIWSKQSRFKWKKLVTLVFAWSFLESKVPDWSVFVWACSWLVSFFSACSLLVSFRQWLVCFRLCLFLIGPFLSVLVRDWLNCVSPAWARSRKSSPPAPDTNELMNWRLTSVRPPTAEKNCSVRVRYVEIPYKQTTVYFAESHKKHTLLPECRMLVTGENSPNRTITCFS